MDRGLTFIDFIYIAISFILLAIAIDSIEDKLDKVIQHLEINTESVEKETITAGNGE